MKKNIFSLITTIMLLVLCGCGVANDNTGTSADTTDIADESNNETSLDNTEDLTATSDDNTEDVSDTVTVSDENLEIEDAIGNIIPMGSFDSDSSHWNMYKESGGSATYSITGGKLKVRISKPGKKSHSVQIYCDGFELLSGGRYRMNFDISSTVPRTLEWRIQLNGGDYHPYVCYTDVEIDSDIQTISCDFTMEGTSDPSPRLCFNLGHSDTYPELGSHEVVIDNVSLELIDDSNAQEVDTSTAEIDVNLNQLGYLPNTRKVLVVRNANPGDTFSIVDLADNKTVFEGDLVPGPGKGTSFDTTFFGDFSGLTQEGAYRALTTGSGESFDFVISDTAYDDAFDAACKMLYLQRCGIELTPEYAGDFAHDKCHTQTAIVYGSDEEIDVTGGWHDAGDYGRYPVAGAKAVADIMLAYENNPSVFSDSVGIPESGNAVPDILDEARYELDWLLKMQNKEGGVYHKVTGLNFEGVVMPEDCHDTLYCLYPSKTATADFAAVMYMAGRIYKDIDSDFSKQCILAADKAIPYYEAHIGDRNYFNPEDVLTGEYGDNISSDEYLWALCEGYKTTGNSSILDKINNFAFDTLPEDYALGWANVTCYAFYAALTSPLGIEPLGFDFKDAFVTLANELKHNSSIDSYDSTLIEDYPWGSNMTICNNGIILALASSLFGDDSYMEYAQNQLDYVCGRNTTSYCFLTGYGTLSPVAPHHRPSQTLGKTMPGMLIGGANSNLEDPFAKAVLKDMAPAHCYIDNAQSYSCNEITIYWNSPYIFLMSTLK